MHVLLLCRETPIFHLMYFIFLKVSGNVLHRCSSEVYLSCGCLVARAFGHFEKPLFMELCKHVETKFVPTGAILFRPGLSDDSIYVVRNGRLKVYIIQPVSGMACQTKVTAGP